ncbi:MAG: hypothetical protein U0452_13260 [Anaerolineae bacterium]
MQIKSKSILMLVVLALLLVAAIGVSAEDEETVPAFNDGRVNSTDIAAPVAVYCEIVYPYSDDVNVGVFNSASLWGLTHAADGEFHELLTVTADDVASAQASGTQVLVAQAYGFSLYANTDGSLTVVAPTFEEGKEPYQFTWTPGETANC